MVGVANSAYNLLYHHYISPIVILTHFVHYHLMTSVTFVKC
jgi:hypothetical protein